MLNEDGMRTILSSNCLYPGHKLIQLDKGSWKCTLQGALLMTVLYERVMGTWGGTLLTGHTVGTTGSTGVPREFDVIVAFR